MKVLHIASFNGNIGDNASHIGFRNILKTLGIYATIDQMEIRRFYKNYSLPDKQGFDESFVVMANQYDLVVFGGGGFLDFWVPNSETGTTIDISLELFDKLNVPVLFTSIGCIPHKEVPEGNIEKFTRFINAILEKKNAEIAVRNDGSKTILKSVLGEEIAAKIPQILDNGFFYQPQRKFTRIIDGKYVAINVTKDQLLMKNQTIGEVNTVHFNQELRKYIESIICHSDLKIVFIPHIFSDIEAIQYALKGVNDFKIRTRVAVAPYVQGDYGSHYLMSVYEGAEYVVGMRFHANVCSLAQNKPISGLAALDRIKYMCESVGAGNYVVDVNTDFALPLFESTIRHLELGQNETVLKSILSMKRRTLDIYRDLLAKLLYSN